MLHTLQSGLLSHNSQCKFNHVQHQGAIDDDGERWYGFEARVGPVQKWKSVAKLGRTIPGTLEAATPGLQARKPKWGRSSSD